MQNENGDLTHDGYMGQGYAQKNPEMREMERQAYEMGNLCFRDWEDSLKQKHPTIYNERRNRKMSLKDWKNKELSENLNKKWGFKMNLNEMAGPPGEWYDEEKGYETMADMKYADSMEIPPEEEEVEMMPGEGMGCMESDPMTGECMDNEMPEEGPNPMDPIPPTPPDMGMYESKRRRKKVLKENKKIRVRIKK